MPSSVSSSAPARHAHGVVAVGGDREGDDGDVVLAAAAVRGGDERLRRAVEIVVVLLDDVEDVVVVDHVRQPVGAEQEDVALAAPRP